MGEWRLGQLSTYPLQEDSTSFNLLFIAQSTFWPQCSCFQMVVLTSWSKCVMLSYGNPSSARGAKISWDYVCSPKACGGLG